MQNNTEQHKREFSFDNTTTQVVNERDTMPDKICCQCHLVIDDGKIYEMDGFQWHEHCFFCSRCHKGLQNRNDFITLTNQNNSDRQDQESSSCVLICNDCSRTCVHCGNQINDMAIILSSNEAYCQSCFKCYKCGDLIKDLKYVKTKKGLYCINCHQRLLAKRQLFKERQLKQQKQLKEENTNSTDDSFALPKRSNMRPRNDHIYNTNTTHRHSRSLSNTNHIKLDDSLNLLTSTNNSRLPSESSINSKINHSRSISLDDVLNATLQNDGFLSDDDISIKTNKEEPKTDIIPPKPLSTNFNKKKLNFEEDNLPSPIIENNMENVITPRTSLSTNNSIPISNNNQSNTDQTIDGSNKSRKSLLDVTENTNSLLKTPEIKRPYDKNTAIMEPLNSPMSTIDINNNITLPHKNNSSNNQFMRTIDLLQNKKDVDINNPMNHINKGLALEFNHTNQEISNMVKSVSHGQMTNMTKNEFMETFNMNKENNNSNNGNGKKLGRSLSLKSKNFFSHWKTKNHGHSNSDSRNNSKISQRQSPALQNSDFDTHSGWGVTPTPSQQSSTSPLPSQQNHATVNFTAYSRHSSRGKSDTLIYSNSKPILNNTNSNNNSNATGNNPYNSTTTTSLLTTPRNKHQRNNSNSATDPRYNSSLSASGVAMFRTPPLDNQTIFRRMPNTVPSNISHSTNSSISKPKIHVSDDNTQERKEYLIKEDIEKVKVNQRENENTSKINTHERSVSLQNSIVHCNNADSVPGEEMKEINDHSNEEEEEEEEEEDDDDDDDYCYYNDDEPEDIEDVELKLRKLKLEVKEMEVTKQKLNIEIDNLKTHRDDLVGEIDKLRQNKQNLYGYSMSPSKNYNEEFSNDNLNIVNNGKKSSVSSAGQEEFSLHASSSNGGKPKFWKLFSGNSTHNNNNSHTMNSLNNGSVASTQRSLGSNLTVSSNNLNNNSDSSIITSLDSSSSRTNSNINYNSSTTNRYGLDNGTTLYNLTLSQYCSLNEDKNDCRVPDLIVKCIDFIEFTESNLNTEGIYRKSGSLSLIEDVERRLYMDHGNLDFDNDDIHVVANVLKRFLRKLPDPIISFDIYDPLMSLIKDNNLITKLPLVNTDDPNIDSILFEFIKVSIKKLLQQLPVEHYEVLKLLIKHINLVAQHNKTNLMNLHNLALVFAPSLIHDITGERDMIDMKERNYVIEFILLHKLVW